MELALLEMLVAAVEERSLSRAAVRQNVVISAASKRIAELERQAGTRLLRRHGRGVEPTPAGHMLYQRAKSILRNVTLARNALASYSRNGGPSLRLAANPSTSVQFLPDDLSTFLARHPSCQLDLVEAASLDIPRMVLNDDADIGIYHAEHPAPGLHSVLYRMDRVGLVVAASHPLAARTELSLEEALDFEFFGYFPRWTLDAFLELVGSTISRPLSIRCQISSYEARCRMVAAGLGVAIVPERVAQNYRKLMDIRLLRLNDAWAERSMFMCVRALETLTDDAGQLFAHLRAVSAQASVR